MSSEQYSHTSLPPTQPLGHLYYMDGINSRSHPIPNAVPGEEPYIPAGRPEFYYPTPSYSDDEGDELPVGIAGGNWGRKTMKGSRWVRRGKAVAWGPRKVEWEAEERARKRLRQLLGPSRSPTPPSLRHLRETSPPLGAPYARPPLTMADGSGRGHGHGSLAAFVLDPAMAHSFRTHLLADLQQTTENLIQGEAALTRALGRLWKVLSEGEHVDRGRDGGASGQPKREDGEAEAEDMAGREHRLGQSQDWLFPMHKLFLTPLPNGNTSIMEPSHFGSPEMQMENMEKSFVTLRELQDDSREYIERLEEIRESIGDIRRQRDVIWMKAREQALVELESLDHNDGGEADEDVE